MKYLKFILVLLTVSGCGAMGFGKNEYVNVYNNSDVDIRLSGDYGTMKIAPHSSSLIKGNGDIPVSVSGDTCANAIISRKVNGLAVVLDIFPGIFAGIIPIVVDFATGNLKTLPDVYTYNC